MNEKLIATSFATLVGLFGGTAGAQETAVKLGVVSVNYNSPTIQIQTDAAIAKAEEMGWEVELFDGRGDQVATNNSAIGFIDRGFDAILNTASANTQMSAVIAHANENNVPFVSTFSGLVPGIIADIGSNNTVDGAIAATELVGRLSGQGTVVVLNWNVLPALVERQKGVEAVLNEYPGIEQIKIEVKVPGQVDDTYNQMTNILLSNPDIDAVVAGWDEIAIPAARAISQSGNEDIFVVSMNGDPETVDAIRTGGPIELTVAYDVPRMGTTAIDVIADALNGTMPSTALLTLKPCLVTQESVPAAGESVNFADCQLFSGETAPE